MFGKYIMYSPLEQFQIIPILPIQFGIIDVSITNETVILVVIFFLTSSLIASLLKKR